MGKDNKKITNKSSSATRPNKIHKPTIAISSTKKPVNAVVSENPQVAKMQARDDQRSSLRKFYQKILIEIKKKDNNPMKSINDFLTYIKKNSAEV